MIKKLTTSFLCIGCATSALAGSVTYTPALDVVFEAPQANWAGVYFGGSASLNGGELLLIDSGRLTNTFPIESGVSVGAFAGYNLQFGNVVGGVEVGYAAAGMGLTTFSGITYDAIYDGKVRLGYSFGKLLAYGFAGYSASTLVDNSTASDVTGAHYGAGLSYLVSDRIFVGVEYMQRNLDGIQSNDPGVLYETNQEVVQLRAGLQF